MKNLPETKEEVEEYCNRVAKKFFAKYTTQYEESAGEEISDKGIYVIYYYHTIQENTIGVYLDHNDDLQVYEPIEKKSGGYF
jgi:hypothetical protein